MHCHFVDIAVPIAVCPRRVRPLRSLCSLQPSQAETSQDQTKQSEISGNHSAIVVFSDMLNKGLGNGLTVKWKLLSK
jgi:hypothetical protein